MLYVVHKCQSFWHLYTLCRRLSGELLNYIKLMFVVIIISENGLDWMWYAKREKKSMLELHKRCVNISDGISHFYVEMNTMQCAGFSFLFAKFISI